VTLQNGLGNAEALSSALGASRVVVGAAEVGATLLSPGRARHGGGNRVRLAAHPRAGDIAHLLVRAGFDVEIVPGTERLLWEKLAATAPLLPLTALLGISNGEVLGVPPPGPSRRRPARWRNGRRPASTFPTATVESRAPGHQGDGRQPFLDAAGRRRGAGRSGTPERSVVREAQKARRQAPVNETLWLASAGLDEGHAR
jgi:2-dehydropantoate 2-reductase